MTTGSVLDILIYVFDRYMLADEPQVPERRRLARALRRAGFERAHVECALDWLTDLAFGHTRAPLMPAGTGNGEPAVRVFVDSELARLSVQCRGYLLSLERQGVLTAQQRELVIERALALPGEPDTEHLKWVVLMVLSSLPGQELEVERLGGLMSELPVTAPH